MEEAEALCDERVIIDPRNIIVTESTQELREIDVIREITNGLSDKEISDKIFISEGTVKNYITSILQKTMLEHRTQIAIKYKNKI